VVNALQLQYAITEISGRSLQGLMVTLQCVELSRQQPNLTLSSRQLGPQLLIR
jgi:hypothetical protein